MKSLHIIYILLAIVAAQFLQACGDNSLIDNPDDVISDCFNIDIKVPLASSRAIPDDLNEFKVRSLHLYFFRAEGHSDAASEYLHDVIVDGEFEFSRSLRLNLPENALRDGGLFGTTSDECYVYAVANVDETLLSARTVDGLKAVILNSNFDKTEAQQSFAMDGLATLSLDRANHSVSGTISLQRAAAKLTLSVDLPSSIDVEVTEISPIDGTEQTIIRKYFSRPDQMHVWMSNGVKKSALNTEPQPADEESLYSNDIIITDGNGSPFTYDASQTKYHYMQDVPFYSYPSKWDPFSPTGNCFLTLEIPWYYYDQNGVMQNDVTYYRLNVQPSKNFIERNTHYDMRVTISRLGSTTIQQPIDMLFDWNYNIPWNTQTLNTDIKEVRYLLLNNNDFSSSLNAYTYTMDNETEISIPYNSSHPVEIESVTLNWRDYYNNADRSLTLRYQNGTYSYSDFDSYTPTSDYAGIEIDHANSLLKLKRDILHLRWSDNGRASITDQTAINAYQFTVVLRHTDAIAGDPATHSTVVITQYPAIYITTELTPKDTRFINAQNTTYRKRIGGSSWNPIYAYYGYLSNSAPNNTQQRRFWLGSYHDSDNYVKNKNTYILTISKFDNDDNYIIADPRTRSVDNLNESGTSATDPAEWSMTATNMTDNANNVLLRNYYPADDDVDKARFIAPKFRVASQWGVTYQMYRRGAQRRCASYQEDGCPAGRWRLPTPAEIEYICRLSNKKYIPYLFGTEGETANYWCSTGGVDVNNSTTNPSVTIVNTGDNDRRAVRCVYDEWFWGNDRLTNKTLFTWGDRARTTTGN